MKYILPGQKIPKEILEKLNLANNLYSKNKDFPKYKKDIATIFNLVEPKKTEQFFHFLAGFIEGEGSLNVSAKKLITAKFGILLDPEFSIAQHMNSVSNLYAALACFQTGRIRYKSGTTAVLVYMIENRKSLEEKVIPFLDKYVSPYGSEIKQQRLTTFKKILDCFNNDLHKDLNAFVYHMLPLWDNIRMQKGQKNQTFETLNDAQNYALSYKRSVIGEIVLPLPP